MLKLLSSNLWSEIETLAANAKQKQVAVAYVSDDLCVKFKAGDTLITDASDERIASGNTSKRLLSDAFQRKVKIYSLQNLHSKIFIFDDVLVIGSTNISSSSKNRLYESGIITDDIKLVSSAQKLLEKYKKHAQKVNKSFLQKIDKIETREQTEKSAALTKGTKSSLLNLMRSNSYLLDDFVIIFHEGKAKLTNQQIKEHAKTESIKLPPLSKWIWYEYDFDKKTEKAFEKYYVKAELKVIGLGISHKDNKINKFLDADSDIQVFTSKIKIGKYIVTNFITDKRPPFKFDKRQLLKTLNDALKDDSTCGGKLFKKTGWVLPAKEFAKIIGVN